MRETLKLIMAGGLKESPFPREEIDILRGILRDVLEDFGFDRGEARPGDADQQTEVRLLQSLMEAFRDPDSYFCEWWSLGVWLGSPTRRLPRAPAIFDRKTKWKFQEIAEEVHGDWQRNYSSMSEHAALVQRQFEE